MTEPVNLNRVRKARAKADAKAQAAANRVKFGRSKGERAVDTSDAQAARKILDGARRSAPHCLEPGREDG